MRATGSAGRIPATPPEDEREYDVGTNELSTLLWRERQLLELLMFKLDEQQLILASGKSRWLPHASREVEQVMERLREASLARAVAVADVGDLWGAGTDASLRQLIEKAPDDASREILDAHLAGLTALTDQITALRDVNEQVLRAAVRSTQETLSGLGDEAATYDARGHAASPADARIFERDL